MGVTWGLTVVCTGGCYLGTDLFVQVGVTWGLTVVCTGGCYLGTGCCLYRWVLPGDRLLFVQVGVTWGLTVVVQVDIN